MNKRRFFPGVIVAAFLTAAVTFFVLITVEKNMLSGYEKGIVWVAAGDLQESLEISSANISDCFVQAEVDLAIIPDVAVKDVSFLTGLRTAVRIPKGSIVTEPMFEDCAEYADGMMRPVIAGCKADDLFQAVSGTLRKGDLINIYTVSKEMGETYLLWSDVLVYETFDSSGKVIAAEDTVTAAARINILIEERYAEQFYNEINNGSLRMVKIWG